MECSVRKRGHIEIFDFSGSLSADLLLLDHVPTGSEAQGLKGRVNGLVIFKDPPTVSVRALERLRRESGAAFIVTVPAAKVTPSQFVDKFVTRQSHDEPLSQVLAGIASEWQDIRYAASDAALRAVRVSRTLTETLRRGRDIARGLKAAIRPVRIAAASIESFGLAPDELGNGIDIADTLSFAVDSGHPLDFGRERDSATGTAALGRAVEDAASGPAVRYPDTAVCDVEDGRKGERVPSNRTLAAEAEYFLEFAFRARRTGIEFDTEPEPLKARAVRKTELLVALSVEPGGTADIPEPVQSITIGPEGDSKTALFRFVPKGPVDGDLRLTVRVYCKFNLIEHVVVSLAVRQRSDTQPNAQRVEQSSGFVKYTGILSEAVAPAALSIDVSRSEQGHQITVAQPGNKALKLHVYPDFLPGDLERCLSGVRDCWLSIGMEVFNSALKPDSARARRNELARLAMAGRDLWQLLFQSGPPSGALWALGAALQRDPLPDGAKITVRLIGTARDFVLPWQLLYDREIEDGAAADPLGFWGLRYLVEQTIAINAVAPEEDETVASARGVAMFVDGTIAQCSAQQEFLASLLADHDPQRALGLVNTRGALKDRLRQGADSLYYFFCHGLAGVPYPPWAQELRTRVAHRRSADGTDNFATQLAALLDNARLDGTDTALRLTRNTVPLKELQAIPETFRADPVVFLNMCESALLYPTASQSFVAFFLMRFAGAVIGTECPVPPLFGEALAREFLPRLIRGDAVGPALLEARRKMMNDNENPLGLAYSLWGQSETVLA